MSQQTIDAMIYNMPPSDQTHQSDSLLVLCNFKRLCVLNSPCVCLFVFTSGLMWVGILMT